jgi:hypothetical protein
MFAKKAGKDSRLSCLFCACFASITQTVVSFLFATELNADLVGQAQSHLPCLFEPALAHAVLARAGVTLDAGLAGVDGDATKAQRARNFNDLVAIERDDAKNFAAAADNGFICRAAVPQNHHKPRHKHPAKAYNQPVAEFYLFKR